MAQVLHPYTPTVFNNIPSLHGSASASKAKDGDDYIASVCQPLVQEHGLEPALGIGLLHELHLNEKLVEFNNISVPWLHPYDNVEDSGGKILPNAWLLDSNSGQLMPYEFFFSPFGRDKSIDLDSLQPFLTEFSHSVKEAGLKDTLALRLFPHVGYQGGLEITEGRVNTNLTPEQFPGGLDNTTEAASVAWGVPRGFDRLIFMASALASRASFCGNAMSGVSFPMCGF